MNSVMIEAIARRLQSGGRLTVMSGAGISAESGIPTFRGPEGYWTVGSKVYHPREMATRAMFDRSPREVWHWYLYRMGVCRRAAPNAGHRAVADLERLLGERFTLITQNVDGLHLRAGSSPRRTLQIHGNVFFMRCAGECSAAVFPLPADVPAKVIEPQAHLIGDVLPGLGAFLGHGVAGVLAHHLAQQQFLLLAVLEETKEIRTHGVPHRGQAREVH